MSGSEAESDSGHAAASRIAADPAFSALDASGAPILAASGDPLRIVYCNKAARAAFGDDPEALSRRLFFSDAPGPRRLAELVQSIRHGAALRLERLCLDINGAPRTMTILCRALAQGEGPPSFVVAALGVRPAAAPEAETDEGMLEALPPEPEAASPGAPQHAPQVTAAALERLVSRHGARARFLWKTDAAGRFIDVTESLADVAGHAGADILGKSVAEVAETFGLDGALLRAIASQRSWSGVETDWPLEGGVRAPVTLGALPVMDAGRGFAGYQGFGVLHLSRAHIAGAVPERRESAPAPETPVEPAPAAPDPYAADNVVPLRPPQREPEAREEPPPEALTSDERSNFEAIARVLRDEADDDGAVAGAASAAAEIQEAAAEQAPPVFAGLDDVAAALESLAAAPAAEQPARPQPAQMMAAPQVVAARALDRLPLGVLVVREGRLLFANRTLLDYLGYADLAAFEADGGFSRMFFGRPPEEAGTRAVVLRSSDGEALDADAHLQDFDWDDGAPATLVSLRRNKNRLPGPEESALALAREREEKLARSRVDNSLLRAILENSGVAVALLGDDGRIESATGAFCHLFEKEKGAFDGLPLAALFLAEEARTLPARLTRAAETGEPLRLRARLGGAAFEVDAKRLGPGQRLCVQLRAPGAEARNDELAAARDAAEQASAAKSDFLARISHEIRTPLNAIIGFAEIMMEERFGPIGSDRYKDYLKDVHASGAHVLSLVNDLLDLSKIEAGKMEMEFDRVDANAVIGECASIMQTQANQAKIVMRLALADRLPMIRADRRSLKQILLNLLSNAMKFNEPGGQVIVSSALTDAGFVVIRVKDTGIGMSEDEVQTALEPFKQVSASHRKSGTGLGLPLTKALIEANNASFTIRSCKREGTLIEIAFPPPQVLAAE